MSEASDRSVLKTCTETESIAYPIQPRAGGARLASDPSGRTIQKIQPMPLKKDRKRFVPPLTKGKCRYTPGPARPVAPSPPPRADARGGGRAQKEAGSEAPHCQGSADPGAIKKKILPVSEATGNGGRGRAEGTCTLRNAGERKARVKLSA